MLSELLLRARIAYLEMELEDLRSEYYIRYKMKELNEY